MNRKLFLLIFTFVVIIFILWCILYFGTLGQKNSGLLPTQVTPTIVPGSIPSPTAYEEMQFTGVDDEGNKEYFTQHPELKTEAQLQSNLPLEYEGFTLDYSYEDDKFTVMLKSPIPQSRILFDRWMNKMGLVDATRFMILNE
jgi:hypothetical protein